jgi:hypothetical protein
LVVELLLRKGHLLAVYVALAGIDRFVGDLVAAQSWCEEDHLSGLVIEVFESILACTCTFL